MDSRIFVTKNIASEIITTEVIFGSLASRGLVRQPLRNFDGTLQTDFSGNIMYEITATYQSLMTKESFVTITI